MDTARFDIIVVGAGIAGTSAASALSSDARVVLLEQETQPGYHATGRSAAILAQTYGNDAVRRLTGAALPLFLSPPSGFTEVPLVKPRPILFIGREDQRPALHAQLDSGEGRHARWIEGTELAESAPLLRDGYAAGGVIDEAGADIDVDALLSAYLRAFRGNGGQLVAKAQVTGARHADGLWHVETPAGHFEAPTLINAAGAWADTIAELAGVEQLGLTPMRRTAVIVAAPEGLSLEGHPMIIDADEDFYLKPDAGRMLLSPADETPSPPCDSQPEELDIAIAVDRIERAFEIEVKRIESSWAGLRTFAPDRTPVCGIDAHAPGFFWLAGQGGYGVQTAPALARLTRDLVLDGAVSPELAAGGVEPGDLAPDRFRRVA